MTQQKLIVSRLPLWLLSLGLLSLYLGVRVLTDLPQKLAVGVGATLLPVALALAIGRVLATQGDRRKAYTRMVLEYLLVLAAVLLYAAQSDTLMWVTSKNLTTVLQVSWPALLFLGLMPALVGEMAIASMRHAPTVELWRVRYAARGARIVVLTLVAFAGVNYAAQRWNRKVDLAHFKTAAAGEAVSKLVSSLSQPVRFVLFFPANNDVLEQVQGYVQALTAQNPLVTVEVVDQALNPQLAKELKVRDNGVVALVAGERSELLKLDVDLEDARNSLRELDAKVQEKLLRLLRPARTAYFTTGHAERDYAPLGDDKRYGVVALKGAAEALGFTVKRLGLGEGLGMRVPADAALVVIAGPTEPFLPEEVASLKAYLDQGGKLWLFVDPDQGSTADELTALLNVTVSKALAMHETLRVRGLDRGDNPYDVITNRVGTHPSVNTLSRAGERYAAVLLGTGAITKRDENNKELKVTFTLRAMPDSFLDENHNGLFDAGKEKKVPLDYAAAIEPNVKAMQDGSQADPKNAMRALVFADVDVASDLVLGNAGNQYLVMDALRFLGGDEDLAGTIESEKDVPIVHKKDKDSLLFYGTSFGVPTLVLGLGLFLARKPRRKEEVR